MIRDIIDVFTLTCMVMTPCFIYIITLERRLTRLETKIDLILKDIKACLPKLETFTI